MSSKPLLLLIKQSRREGEGKMDNRVVFVKKEEERKKNQELELLTAFLSRESQRAAIESDNCITRLREKIREKKKILGEKAVKNGFNEIPEADKEKITTDFLKAEKNIKNLRKYLSNEFREKHL
jgi:hypothetical protein